MNKRFNTAPVPIEKINLIKDLLSSPSVNELWINYVNLGTYGGSTKEREIAFRNYTVARDAFLGLPPLSVPSVEQTYRDRNKHLENE